MLATVVAFSIFLTNPAGTLGPKAGQQAAPYFFPNESQEREYATMDECEQGIAQAHTAQGSILQALYQEDAAKYYTLKAKYDSMQCRQVTRQIETNDVLTAENKTAPVGPTLQAAKDTAPAEQTGPYKTVYRIGRFDDKKIFHGTTYNTANYDTKEDCDQAYHKTEIGVVQRATREGGDEDGAAQVLKQFDQTYACHQITIDPSVQEAAAPAQAPTPQAPVAQEAPQPQAAPQYNPNPFAQAVPQQRPQMRPAQIIMTQPMPTRQYYIAEHVSGEGIDPYWVVYEQGYSSVAECQRGMREDMDNQQTQIQENYNRVWLNVGITPAQRWFQLQIQQLQSRRSRMQCVTR